MGGGEGGIGSNLFWRKEQFEFVYCYCYFVNVVVDLDC